MPRSAAKTARDTDSYHAALRFQADPSHHRETVTDVAERQPESLRQSQLLHERVIQFAESSLAKPKLELEADRESIAKDLFSFQRKENAGIERLARWAQVARPSVELPALPTDAFRLGRVATHPLHLDRVRFQTSGTTQAETGVHPIRDLGTYERLALLLAEHTLFSGLSGHPMVLALAPPPEEPGRSSLTHMMRVFAEHFDGRAITREPQGAAFLAGGPDRFLLSDRGPNLEALRRAVRVADARGDPIVLLCTSFALLAALDELEGETLPFPQGSRIMLTGGFKGRSREISLSELWEKAACSFELPADALVLEYGMTELTSQLYGFRRADRALYQAPPWLMVSAVDPRTEEPVSQGEIGIAKFIDLGNVDSAVAVLTQDQIRIEDGCIELLGRAPQSPARGCSLAYEGLLRGSAQR